MSPYICLYSASPCISSNVCLCVRVYTSIYKLESFVCISDNFWRYLQYTSVHTTLFQILFLLSFSPFFPFSTFFFFLNLQTPHPIRIRFFFCSTTFFLILSLSKCNKTVVDKVFGALRFRTNDSVFFFLSFFPLFSSIFFKIGRLYSTWRAWMNRCNWRLYIIKRTIKAPEFHMCICYLQNRRYRFWGILVFDRGLYNMKKNRPLP